MLPLDDPRWSQLKGGYRLPYDPTGALLRLESGQDDWDELWQELHHQGDVGEASYAAVPHLVRIGKSFARRDRNFYGLISTIEIERHRETNPPLPDWLVPSYAEAMRDLLNLATADLRQVNERDTIRSAIGAIALVSGDVRLGALICYSDNSVIDDLVENSCAWSELYCERPIP